ncbi:MAG: hypothetical protein K2W92_02670 [Alphaproteobacteria bacterium]|nr:hypothetical protein [Alphaproteobacteria bacterium]
MNKNDLIIGLSNEFLIELGKTKPSNLQNAVNKHYDLWNKDGGLIQMLTERDLGVYKVLASILVSGGYEHANEMNVGRCVRRLLNTRNDDISSYVDTQTKGNPSLVKPGGVVPGSAVTLMTDKVVKSPVVQEKNEGVGLVVYSPRSSTENHTSSGSVSVSWWDEVAQSLGIEIKKVPEGFNWNNVDANLTYQRDREYSKTYNENELLLFGHVLFNARKEKIPMSNVFKATTFIIKSQGDIAYELMTKAMMIETITV